MLLLYGCISSHSGLSAELDTDAFEDGAFPAAATSDENDGGQRKKSEYFNPEPSSSVGGSHKVGRASFCLL